MTSMPLGVGPPNSFDPPAVPRRLRLGAAFSLLAIALVCVVLYRGLVARGELWPVFDLLANVAPLMLLTIAGGWEWLSARRARR